MVVERGEEERATLDLERNLLLIVLRRGRKYRCARRAQRRNQAGHASASTPPSHPSSPIPETPRCELKLQQVHSAKFAPSNISIASLISELPLQRERGCA